MRPSFLLFAALLAAAEAPAQISGFPASLPISSLGPPHADSVVANGVDTATGAFTMDLPVLKIQGIRDIPITLIYNSLRGAGPDHFGQRWVHNFEVYLELSDPEHPAFTRGVGWERVHYSASGRSGLFLSSDESARYDRLQRKPDGSWRLERLDGTVYEFDSRGLITKVGNRVGQYLEIRRGTTSSRVISVHEPIANRYLFFRYRQDGGALIEALADSEDRIAYFEYDEQNRLRAIYDPVTLGLVQGDRFSSKPIPDNTPTGVTHLIHVARSEPVGLVEIRQAQIIHSRPADLTLRLISPRGTEVRLTPGYSAGDNEWRLDGRILPQFNGEDPSGDWRVIVTDGAAGRTGTLNTFQISFTGPATATRFEYNAEHQITRASDTHGARLFANSYDAAGRVIAQDDGIDTNQLAEFTWSEADGSLTTTYKDRVGAKSTLLHDAGYHLLRVTDPLNQVVTFTYNSNGDRVAVTDPLERTVRFEYDASGNMTSVTDAGGNTTRMVFEAPFSHDVTTITDPYLASTRFTYDGSNNIVRVQDAAGYSSEYAYGAGNRMTSASTASGNATRFYYDSSSMLSGADHPVAGYRRPGARYDNVGRMISLVDGDGFETRYEYDSRDNITAVIDPRGKAVRTQYDLRGRIASKSDRLGNTTTYTYDGNSNVVAKTNALNQTVRYEYDGEDRLIRTINAAGAFESRGYDAAGQLVSMTDAEGHVVRYRYNATGELVSLMDGDGNTIANYGYDERGLRTREEDSLGNVTQTVYDAVGRPVQTIDRLGRKTTLRYDKLGRLISVTDPLNRTVRQRHLQDGLVEYIVDPKGQETYFRYDQARRLLSITSHGGRTVGFRYGGRDQITEQEWPSGRTFTYAYDSAGRLTRVSYTGPGSLPASEILSTYDDQGNLIEVKSSGSAGAPPGLRRSYDGLNRMTKFTDASGNVLQYAYDDAGNMIRLTYPDGKAVVYDYDHAGRMTRITDWAGRVTEYLYDTKGRLTKATFPNGTTRSSQYDDAGRLVHRRDEGSGGTIVDLTYRYDAEGRVLAVIGNHLLPSTDPPSVQFTYDNDNRLARFNGQTAQFDANGEMIRGPLNGVSTTFTYDRRANLIAAGGTTYSYDEEEHLIGIAHGGTSTTLVVNPLPRLSQVLVRNEGGVITRYVYGIGLAYEDREGEVRVYHYDQAGNTIAFSSSSGEVTGRLSYGPFGEPLARDGDTASPFLYGGLFGIYTEPNGLCFMRFRWYSPEIRRFLNEDSRIGDISRLATLNRFAYAANDPVSLVDPSGEFFEVFVGAIVGAVVGVAGQFAYDLVRGEWSGWESYAGAALGGAVSGAVLAACPTCLFAAGALGATEGYLIEHGLLGESIDPAELATTGLVGGLTGWAAGKAGKLFQDSSLGKAISLRMGKVSNYFASVFGKDPAAKPLAEAAVDAAEKWTLRKAGKEAAANLAKKVAAGAARGGAERTGVTSVVIGFAAGLIHGSAASTSGPIEPGKLRVYAESRENITAGRTHTFGEFAHFNVYLSALKLAGRPQPVLTNNLLTVY